jgi:hypothetical protein
MVSVVSIASASDPRNDPSDLARGFLDLANLRDPLTVRPAVPPGAVSIPADHDQPAVAGVHRIADMQP